MPPYIDVDRNFTQSATSAHQFHEFTIKTSRFNLIIAQLTNNTFVLAVLPPGEAEMNCAKINIATAREEFTSTDDNKSRERNVTI
jgi:hypothetical protein